MEAVDRLMREYFEQRKNGNIKAIHMTIGFYYQALADKDFDKISPLYIMRVNKKYFPFFGLDPVIHFGVTAAPFWFEVDARLPLDRVERL